MKIKREGRYVIIELENGVEINAMTQLMLGCSDGSMITATTGLEMGRQWSEYISEIKTREDNEGYIFVNCPKCKEFESIVIHKYTGIYQSCKHCDYSLNADEFIKVRQLYSF